MEKEGYDSQFVKIFTALTNIPFLLSLLPEVVWVDNTSGGECRTLIEVRVRVPIIIEQI